MDETATCQFHNSLSAHTHAAPKFQLLTRYELKHPPCYRVLYRSVLPVSFSHRFHHRVLSSLYQKDLAVLKAQEELYHKFKEFRGKSLHLQLEREQEQYFERMESLHSEYKDVLTEPVVVDFLSAEQRMCKLMRLVYDGIAEDIKLDLSYMDEL